MKLVELDETFQSLVYDDRGDDRKKSSGQLSNTFTFDFNIIVIHFEL